MQKVLIVEDDKALGNSLVEFLKGQGLEVLWAPDIATANKLFDDSVDIIILDWTLPDGQGIDLLKTIRATHNTIPIIMLTARVDLIDKVIGLESGADDYVTKPFEPRELVARIRVQLRKESQTPPEKTKIIVGDLIIDSEQRVITYKKKQIDFTKMEFDFLSLLADSPNRAFSREEILNKVWGYENYPTTRTVDTHVLQIRQKLSDQLIETVRGIGYKFVG